jgi:hypothetical protein
MTTARQPSRPTAAGHPTKPSILRRMAEAQHLIGGKKKHILSARLDEALVAAAKACTGISSDTELAEYALAAVALGDDYGEWLLSLAGRLDPSFDLGL